MRRYIYYFVIPLLLSCSSDIVHGDDEENDDFEYVAGGYIFGEEIYIYKNRYMDILDDLVLLHERKFFAHIYAYIFIIMYIYPNRRHDI